MSLPKDAKVVLFAGIFNISLTFFKYWFSSISGEYGPEGRYVLLGGHPLRTCGRGFSDPLPR